jgi:hypothetical protein
MHRSALVLAAIAAFAATPLLAASPQSWPWTAKTPPDPALATLSHVDGVTAAVTEKIVSISVKAMAPSPGYSELQLVARMGDPDDRIFAFDARGRPPQETASQVLTPVTIEASFADAPVSKLEMIEVYSNDNCLAYSVKDKKPADCTSKALPQKPGALP